ncbi:GATA zinc finger domain-containing protein 14-like [Teleopsis dalmanni]|uniref:GATA zinc finger domain-containing protein 14-like n=1 Tax=Teleopsis dalmanni TaxID=139649 RepID=UPI0018CD1EB7|nr:GATA zinc finger domain-containing protein 14-like [Teleopsis dalmanni]
MDRSGYHGTSISDFSESVIDEDRSSSDIIPTIDNVVFRRNRYNRAHNQRFHHRRRNHISELFATTQAPIEILSSRNDARRRRRMRRRYYNRLYSRHSHRRLRRGRHEHFNELLALTQSYDENASSNYVTERRRRQYERYNRRYDRGHRRMRSEHTEQDDSNELLVNNQSDHELASFSNVNGRQYERYNRRYNRGYRRMRSEHTEQDDSDEPLVNNQSDHELASFSNVNGRQYERYNPRYNRGYRRMRSEHTEQDNSEEPLVNNQSNHELASFSNVDGRRIGQHNSYDSGHTLDASRQHAIEVLLATHLNDEPASRNRTTIHISQWRNLIYNGRHNVRRIRRLNNNRTEQVGQSNLYSHQSNELLDASPSRNEVTPSSYVDLNSRRYNRYGRQRFLRGRIGRDAQRDLDRFDPSNETVYSSNIPTRRRRSNNRHFLSYNRYNHRLMSRSRSPQADQRNVESYHELLTLSEVRNIFGDTGLRSNTDRRQNHPSSYSGENGHMNHNRLNSLSNHDEIASASTATRHRRQGHQLFWPRRTENRNPSNLSLLIPTDRLSEESLPDIVVRLDMDNGDDGPFIWQQQLRSRSGLINLNNANGDDDESIYSEPVPITSEMLQQIYPHILHHLIEQVSPEPFNYNQVIKFYIRNSNVSETDVLYSLVSKITADPGLRANNVLNEMLGVNPSTDQIETDFTAAGDFNYPIFDEELEIENPDNIEDDLNDVDDRGIIIEIQFPPNEQNNVEVNE